MDATSVARDLWSGCGGAAEDLDRLTVVERDGVLPSVFRVSQAATGSVAAATVAVAGLWRDRGGPDTGARVDMAEVGRAFRSERLVERTGAPLPPVWDPVAGTYRTRDGWIRLHTNLTAHRTAALTVLRVPAEADAVAEMVAGRSAVALERAVIEAGGAAAALRTRDAWQGGAQAAALAAVPLVDIVPLGSAAPDRAVAPHEPLAGVRVLDLTRVIAGPVCGRFLAAYGAEVLRVDGPTAEDVPALVADTTVGKRSTVLDLREAAGQARFARLLSEADVVLLGYRPGAVERLGYGAAELARRRPGIVVGSLSAYGGVGPWGRRRGFDSLVQLATGIADEGRRHRGSDVPVPLPAQVLDHASGYLLALGVLAALRRRFSDGGSWSVGVSLARTAGWLD
ncbi:MAG: CoA transferase, partial [Micromonosporaceae bacterium]